MVTSRERVAAALAMEVADRAPVAAWGHTYDAEWAPDSLAEATVRRQKDLGWDFVKLQVRASCFAEALGATFRPSGDTGKPPVAVEPLIHQAADWDRVPALPAGAPLPGPLAEQIVCLRRVIEGVGPDVPVIQTLFSPLSVAAYLVGRDPERAVRELREDTALLGRAMERIAELLIEFARQSVAAGAAGVFYAIVRYASTSVMSGDEYDTMVLPFDEQVLRALPEEAWFNVLHLCGDHVLFDLARRLPAHAISWSIHDPGNPGLADGRLACGRAVVGGLHRRSPIATGTPNEVLREAQDALAAAGPSGLVLTPGCSVSPWPWDKGANFLAILQAAEAAGRG